MNTRIDVKEQVACVMCDMVLDPNPITFPCDCLMCSKHLHDHFVKEKKIQCSKCEQSFHVSNENFKE